MDFSPATLAAGKLIAVFALLVLLLRLRVNIGLCILSGALAVALLTGISPSGWPLLIVESLTRPDFLLLCAMVFFILLLSAVQDATGQSRKLVDGLKLYLDKPRLRLVIFPALVGLLPMPGGALFSCPMIEATAKDMQVNNEKKGLINYWFRHIWETAWPLYPGYALVCTLVGISLAELCKYTFPLVFLAFGAGWFYYVRDITPSSLPKDGSCRTGDENIARQDKDLSNSWADSDTTGKDETLAQVLMHALPIGITLAGAVFFAILLGYLAPDMPGQVSFSLSLVCAIATAFWQGHMRPGKHLFRLAFSRNTGRIMLLLASIYIFKECIGSGGLIQDLSTFGDNSLLILLSFIILPFVSGVLTGIMVGFVGVSFPILLAILDHSPLKEYLLPLVVLAIIAGNCGQLLSPLHVCLVVTCEFFNTRLPGVWRSLVLPTFCIFLGGLVWVLLLAAFHLHF